MTDFALKDDLDERCVNGLYRTREIVHSPQSTQVKVGNKRVLNFCSNDYLGLASHPAVVKAFQQGVEQYGVGSGAAHLVCGHSQAHHQLEEALAEFTGRPRALLFSTGYMANLGAVSALVGRGDHVFEDRLNHASLLDGALLSGAHFKRYAHANAQSLGFNLVKPDSGRKLVVTDGVFSMDGTLAPLPALLEQCRRTDSWLLVDDAHGLGVIGETGGGIVEHYGLTEADVPVLVGTLGKAFGTFGAFVAGSHELIETLIQKARTYIYTTALPPAVAEATLVSLRLAKEESWRREKLQSLIRRFTQGADELGLQRLVSETPIQPIIIGDVGDAVYAAEKLLADDIWVTAIRPPTVPTGGARLRVTFSANHEEAQVERLLEALARVLK